MQIHTPNMDLHNSENPGLATLSIMFAILGTMLNWAADPQNLDLIFKIVNEVFQVVAWSVSILAGIKVIKERKNIKDIFKKKK